MAKRRIQLGIDYGTCHSKIVLRDYGAAGGEKAYVLIRGDFFLIPSTVFLTSSRHLLLGSSSPSTPREDRRFDSVKMRVAGEVTGEMERYFYGSLNELPPGFSAKDLAVLTVWFLISHGHLAARELLGPRASGIEFGMTLGIPMSFFQDQQLREAFIKIARLAWRIFQREGPCRNTLVSLPEARCVLDAAAHDVAKLEAVPENEVRYWVRSEAEAAMWWPFQSPAIPAGPYAKVDIGAGTTNASVFRIVGTPEHGSWRKSGIAFFGACSYPVGMDALDKTLAPLAGVPDSEAFSLRGEEDRLLQGRDARYAANHFLEEEVREAYRKAWIQAFERIRGSQAELDQFGDHGVFVIGGGSLVEAVKEAVRRHPGREHTLNAPWLERPADLERADGKDITEWSLPFLAVAYGLSHLAMAIPEANTPEEVPPLPELKPSLERLDRDDIYAK